MIKLYKSIVFFVVLIVMNISVQAHLGYHSLCLSKSSNKTSIVSSGKDWAGLAPKKVKQVTDFINYPNPAVTQTTIAYTLTSKSSVLLKVIDLAGKQLAVLVKQDQTAGKQEYFWELSKNRITSGMYILILQVDSKTYSRKMIVQ